MQATVPPYQHVSRRRALRMRISGLSVSIRRSGIFYTYAPTPCILFDINYGGLSILWDRHDLKVLDKIKLFLIYKNNEYKVQGVIAYKNVKEEKMQYGVIFTKVPIALDRQIESWNRDTKHLGSPLLEKHQQDSQRRSEKRYKTSQFVVKITSNNPSAKFNQCTGPVINVSCHGLRFASPIFHQPLGSLVSLEVCYERLCFPADGVVRAIIPTESGYQYGVKVTTQNPSYMNFIEHHFTENSHQN